MRYAKQLFNSVVYSPGQSECSAYAEVIYLTDKQQEETLPSSFHRRDSPQSPLGFYEQIIRHYCLSRSLLFNSLRHAFIPSLSFLANLSRDSNGASDI